MPSGLPDATNVVVTISARGSLSFGSMRRMAVPLMSAARCRGTSVRT
jgi:hypothetical protein